MVVRKAKECTWEEGSTWLLEGCIFDTCFVGDHLQLAYIRTINLIPWWVICPLCCFQSATTQYPPSACPVPPAAPPSPSGEALLCNEIARIQHPSAACPTMSKLHANERAKNSITAEHPQCTRTHNTHPQPALLRLQHLMVCLCFIIKVHTRTHEHTHA